MGRPLKKFSRVIPHKSARVAFARRLEMVREMTELKATGHMTKLKTSADYLTLRG